MKHFTQLLLACILLALSAQMTFSQTLSLPGDGRDFWVGYMYPSFNKPANPGTEAFYSASLLISSYTQNSVGVFYFNRQTGVEVQAGQYSIPARTGIQVPIQLLAVKMQDSGDLAEFAAIHITAKRAINVEFFSTGACSGGSFLPITTAGLGESYVIASYVNNPGELGIIGNSLYPVKYIENSVGFFEIIAPFDGTQVTITPNSTTLGGHQGYSSGAGANHTKHPYTVSLQRGQCYLVKSAGDADNTDDISGSLVTSNHPIAVIAGHENAALGGVTQRALEGRDFMVEQMYPIELCDTTGYVMIPLRDSQPADPATYEGVGENYRTYAFADGTLIDMFQCGVSGATDMSTGQLAQPPPEKFEVQNPVDFEGRSNASGQPQKKFSVMMYDLRNFANSAPYPAPSMITVIPISRWRTSFLWYVPANKFETLQGYYVDIIAPTGDFTSVLNGIKASFNGGPIRPLKSILTPVTTFPCIPNHPELTGIQFKLSPGSYYATGPHPFMVYNFGFRALDPNFDLGDFDGDDYFFSYGLPVGLRLGGTPHIRVTVDTSCASWRVCVHDSTLGLTNQGIKSIDLMDDPTGDQFDIHPGKQFLNTRLDDSLDPDHTGSINLNGDDTDFCFNVLVNHPIDSGYAPLFIADDQGGAVLVELSYKPPSVKLTPDSGGNYLALQVLSPATDSCSNYVLKNTAIHDPKDTLFLKNNFHLNAATLKHNTPGFTITGTVPALPTTIHAGDSVIITACYSAVDTFQRIDTILLATDCFDNPVPLVGSGAIPIIWASNHDFGSVIVDSTKCDTVGVYNIGKYPFTLNSKWFMDNYGASLQFKLDASDSIKLASPGIILKPGQKYLFTFCYTPIAEVTDSATQHWGNTLEAPYQHSNKDFSLLLGKGVKTGFQWDRTIVSDTVECQNPQTTRVNLFNNASEANGPPSHVDTVYITGPNAADFSILGNTAGFNPFRNFDLYPAPGNPPAQPNSIGVDVVFQPTGVPSNYTDRHARIVAHGVGQNDVFIDFVGTINHATSLVSPTSINYGQVVLGEKNVQTFSIQDTGTADLVVQCIQGISYPIINVSGIALDTVIPHGPLDSQPGIRVSVEMGLTDFTDTCVDLILCYKTACTHQDTIHLCIAASFINPSNTGHNYDSVFLNCRNLLDSVTGFNKGSKPLTLQRIEIIKDDTLKSGSSNPGQFTFSNGTQTLLITGKASDTIFAPHTQKTYPVKFSPTVEGWDTAIVKFTWDSAGVKIITTTNLLIGYGRLEHETFAPIQAVVPAVKTGASIAVPITLVDTLPADVGANGVTFTVTYRSDLLDIQKDGSNHVVITSGDKNAKLDNNDANWPIPTPILDANGKPTSESVTFNLKSNSGPITAFIPWMIQLHYNVMVAQQVQSPILISNAVFWGSNPLDTLCYVINTYDSTYFTPSPTCGDTTLRAWLGSTFPTKIVSISPNPVIGISNPEINYKVNIDQLPVTIELFNALGTKIRVVTKNNVEKKGDYTIAIGAKDLPSGLYVIRISSPGYVESGQFIIQK